MTEMIGSASTASPVAAGTQRNSARRRERARVLRNASVSPRAACALTAGNMAVAIATPNTPMGNCMSRNAQFSQATAPSPKNDANQVFTNTLIWTAATATTDGPSRPSM